MIQNYQEQMEMQEPEPINATFAKVIEVQSSGLIIQIEGEDNPREKPCKCNRFGVFHVGDRVRIIKDGGSYVVEYPVGNPSTATYADGAGVAAAVDNLASGYADIKFYYATRGHLLVKVNTETDQYVEFVAKGYT